MSRSKSLPTSIRSSRARLARAKRRHSVCRWALLAIMLAFVAASCGGGGCSSCSGVTPLPGGFVAEKRIENSASLRITSSGLQFLDQNLGAIAGKVLGGGAGGLEFAVPNSTGSIDLFLFSIDYEICVGGPQDDPKKCKIEIDATNANLHIAAINPHNITITGTLPLRLLDLPIHAGVDADITLSGNQACPGDSADWAQVGVNVNISVETDLDPAHARYGYSRLHIEELTVTKDDIKNSIKICGGIIADIIDFFKGFVVDFAYDQLIGTVKDSVESQLCQKSDPMVSPSCPNGTFDVDGTCRYENDPAADCVSMALGTDGHADLGGLLASISPGTKGGLDFLLAGGGQDLRDDGSNMTWGDLNTVGGGATLGMFGGVEPNPVSGCVPLSNLPLPTAIPIPAEMIDDSIITNWPAGSSPHLGIGISERFFNYALSGMYNSGLLCLGISTEGVPALNSGTLGLLAGSLRDLGLQRETQPIAIVIRPSTPPHVTFGNGTDLKTDPNILLELKQASFDFYMFSSDRYIRFMTATFDISAPINLTVTPDGLIPVLDTLDVTNGTVTNSDLLKDDPAVIAGALQGLLASQVGALLGGGIPAVDINGPLAGFGLKLDIPPTVEGQGSPGLRKMSKNGDNFLGIFGSFQTAAFQANEIDTTAQIIDKKVDQAGLRAETITKDNGPVVTILARSPADTTQEVEYQARVDGGLWKPFSKDRYLEIHDPAFRLEGKHEVDIRSRIVGQSYSLDRSPARVEVIIDTVAPEVKVSTANAAGDVTLSVFDLVSQTEGTQVRYRLDGDAWSAWMPATEAATLHVGDKAADLDLEVRDEEGNLGTSQQEIIRGLPHGTASGCGCTVAERDTPLSPWSLGLVGVAIAGAAARIARGRRGLTKKSAPKAKKSPGFFGRRQGELMGAAIVLGVAGTYSGCSCGNDSRDVYQCVEPNCVALEPGLIGSYTSATVANDKLWVAGYLEADYDNSYQYGDLVVGTYNGDDIDWKIVDGVPSDPPPDSKAYNAFGFRGGQTEPGDDVGLWTSIAVDGSGNAAVAYYDRTNKALKFAHSNGGDDWKISVVDGGSGVDAGRYAKLHYEGDTAVIAYLEIEPGSGSGFITSKVRVARGNEQGFTIEDAVVNASTPCRAAYCSGGTVCVESTGQCTAKGTGCAAACASGQECISDNSCQKIITTDKLDAYPMATGLYIATASLPDGSMGIAYYDRIAGSLDIAQKKGGAWASKTIDGGNPDVPSDVGIGASLFIDGAGDWHLAYVDGYTEGVKYARVSGEVVKTEAFDDGLHVGGVAFPDGQHIVGDDSSITVDGSGTVHITYQDATNGKLRYATGTPNASGHDWKVKVVDAPNFGGFFSHQVELGGALQLVHWSRKAGDKTEGNVSVVSPP